MRVSSNSSEAFLFNLKEETTQLDPSRVRRRLCMNMAGWRSKTGMIRSIAVAGLILCFGPRKRDMPRRKELQDCYIHLPISRICFKNIIMVAVVLIRTLKRALNLYFRLCCREILMPA